MTDYMVLAINEEERDFIASVFTTLSNLMKENKCNVIYVGSLEKVRPVALEEGLFLPFFSFVSSFEELDEVRGDGERMIFFDEEGDAFSSCLHIMENTACRTFLYLGNHEKYFSRLVLEASPNLLASVILSDSGNRIFPFPRTAELTKENIIDALINVDSLTSNPFFDAEKPFILIDEKRRDIDYQWIVESAKRIGSKVVLKTREEIMGKADARAILSFSSLSHEQDLTIYFGLPFWYINAVRLPDKAISGALRITKIISRGKL